MEFSCLILLIIFLQALRERGNVYMKQGNLKAAAKDFEEIVSTGIC